MREMKDIKEEASNRRKDMLLDFIKFKKEKGGSLRKFATTKNLTAARISLMLKRAKEEFRHLAKELEES